jgi:hypothetical protein
LRLPELLAPPPTPNEIRDGFANPEIHVTQNSEEQNEYWASFFWVKITPPFYSSTSNTSTAIYPHRPLLHRLAQWIALLDLSGLTERWTDLTEQLLTWPWDEWLQLLLLLLTWLRSESVRPHLLLLKRKQQRSDHENKHDSKSHSHILTLVSCFCLTMMTKILVLTKSQMHILHNLLDQDL